MRPTRDDAALDDLLEAWFSRRHAGEEVDVDELCARTPQLRDDLEHAIQRHMALITPMIEAETAQVTAAPPAPRHFEHLGDYRIKKRIGRGGMSEVFLARQESLDRLVAVKVLHAVYAEDAAYRLRFRREAEIAGALDHPHIVPIYETGEADGVLFLAMKLIDGVPMDQADRITDPKSLAAMGARVARALHAAHEVGIIHRDVKPANILVDGDHPFVVDFGLARSRADITLTRPGQSPGTLQYMAPEQIRGGAPSIDPRVDVYGLGATLFACFYGEPPFDADDPQSLLHLILFGDPPHKRVKGRARDLDVILRRALDKEPARRFPSTLALAEDLENLAADRAIRSRPTGLVERLAIKARRNPRTSLTVAIATVVTIVLAIAVWGAARAAESRVLQQLEIARTELAANRPSKALARLAELPGARAQADDAQQLIRTARTRLHLEALLDELQVERRNQDLPFLEDLEARVLTGDPAVATSKEAWVAQLMIATYADRATAVARLLDDERASSFPRLSTLCRTRPGSEAAALATAPDATTPEDAALDAVAVSALFRSREADPALVAAELARPAHSTTRLLFGQAMMKLLDKHDQLADLLLRAILRDDRPHPEVHILLARIAGRAGRIELAREHLHLARTDQEASARPTPLRHVLAEAEIELMHGDMASSQPALERARQAWGERPEVILIESHMALVAGDTERSLELLQAACDNNPLPWTWRRAKARILELRARAVDPTAPDREESASIAADARELRQRARDAFDTFHEARAENVLAYLAVDPEDYVTGLERVLELEPGNTAASVQFIVQLYAWVVGQGLPVTDRLAMRSGRAVELARANVRRQRIEPRFLTAQQFAMSTLYGATLAARLHERDAAVELGAAAHHALERQPDAELQNELESLRRELQIAAWNE